MIKKLFKRSTASDELLDPIIDPALCFIHIPKTAGSSFRVALEKSLPLEKDYGKSSAETTELIKNHLDKEDSSFYLREACQLRPFSISGHMGVQRYSDMYSVRNIITFVREPLSQVVSHFNHHVNHNQFTLTFQDFYQKPSFINLQSKSLSGIPLSLIGHIGVTERYNESIDIINAACGLTIEKIKVNQCSKAHKSESNLSNEELDELRLLNEKDLAVYEQALLEHKQRYQYLCGGLDWAHIYATVNANNVLSGAAFWAADDKPVEFDLEIDGICVDSFTADKFFGQFPKFNFPRFRYIGFRLQVGKWVSKETAIELVVKKTGQRYPLILPTRSI
ncbi:hypothetical protein [Vibrio sp. 10N.261.52.F3]|uniref:hypothetical protein n=1 Tax=Vibrio sp. 10N.261.52.F3 TaxID=3229683 RepID=UPI00354EB10B